jgi:tetratricopeptide (TPR) repeat protein
VGHSLFTGTLIDGLKNKDADLDGDGIVTSSELGLYLQQQVGQAAQAKGSGQTPDFGEFNLDNRGQMVISYRLDDANDHFEVGRKLYDLGRRLDDRGRFESAIRHFDKAMELSPRPSPEAQLERGRALLALERYAEAITALRTAAGGEQSVPEAPLLEGIAQAKRGETAQAAECLSSFLKLKPDDSRAPWIQELVRRLSAQAEGQKRALLIGIGRHADAGISTLKGPENDVQAVQDLLVEKYGWPKNQITPLLDEAATRDGILRELDSLSQAAPGDTVLIYYSGHATSGDSPTYLVPYDTVQEPSGLKNTIDAQELHSKVNRIPALSKTLILDTHATVQFTKLAAEQANYNLFLATKPDQYASEQPID